MLTNYFSTQQKNIEQLLVSFSIIITCIYPAAHYNDIFLKFYFDFYFQKCLLHSQSTCCAHNISIIFFIQRASLF